MKDILEILDTEKPPNIYDIHQAVGQVWQAVKNFFDALDTYSGDTDHEADLKILDDNI